MGDRYLVVSGIDYDHDTKRAEADDVIDDLPAESVPWLLECGAIQLVADDLDVTGSQPLVVILDVDSDPEPDPEPDPDLTVVTPEPVPAPAIKKVVG